MVKYGIQVLQIEDKTVLVNNTTNTIKCRAVMSQHTTTPEQPTHVPESCSFTLGAAGDQVCGVVPCWDVLQDSQTAEDIKLLLSLESAEAQWSPPALVRTDFPRQERSCAGGAGHRLALQHQKETLPTLQLCIITDTPTGHSATPTGRTDTPPSPGWTDAIDISSPGTQVVFLPGFGCLYIDVLHQSGTITLTLAPESSAGDIVTHHRPSDQVLSFRILLNEASVALCDDITSPSSSVELLRLTVSKLLLQLPLGEPSAVHTVQIHCAGLQVDNQLYERASFHFPVILCQESLSVTVSTDGQLDRLVLRVRPAHVYLEDTFIYYMKTLFHTYIPECTLGGRGCGGGAEPVAPREVLESTHALVTPVLLQKLSIEPVHLLVSIHASLKLYIASNHTPLSFSLFERSPICTTPRQLVHTLAMHYAAGALFRAGWVVGSLEILGSPASLVRSIGNGVSEFFRLPYEGLTRGPGAFISSVSRGTNSFIKHISKGAIAGIVDQPMQTFTRTLELPNSVSSAARGIISRVGKDIVGVFTKPIGGAAELVSQTGYG
ncbi:vacuolar protein sorting-associated protein 13B-like [Sinocyclocheilus anshuiensis]|uniref:vacuolar protein sorting-associated protein 13B-like n=1 Tax=Sinocyclocheilus anshuiensis TaxID=1608454 RepID=UPI0007B99AAF|nr:PREDICTED: vacuolar protein sorting-associated protein 13B-like [Sinocyclocheilus anshuiensis]